MDAQLLDPGAFHKFAMEAFDFLPSFGFVHSKSESDSLIEREFWCHELVGFSITYERRDGVFATLFELDSGAVPREWYGDDRAKWGYLSSIAKRLARAMDWPDVLELIERMQASRKAIPKKHAFAYSVSPEGVGQSVREEAAVLERFLSRLREAAVRLDGDLVEV